MIRMVIRSRRLPLIAGLIAILLLAACAQNSQESVTPGSGTQSGDPDVQIALLVGGSPQPVTSGTTVGPNPTFRVTVSDPTLSGVRSITYQFNDGEVTSFELSSGGTATIAPLVALTGASGSLVVNVETNAGRSSTRQVTFNVDSVAPAITSLRFDGTELVSGSIPAVLLTADSGAGVQLDVTATDSGPFASTASIIVEVDGEIVASAVGSLSTLLSGTDFEQGSHSARVYAVDQAGNVSRLYSFIIAVNEPGQIVPPSVAIAAPSEGSVYPQGANIEVVVNSLAGSDEIASVHVAANGIELSSTDRNIFTGVVPSTAGDYTLIAWAVGRDGGRSENVTREIVVSDAAPSVSIESPSDMQTYFPGEQILVSLDIQDAGGGIGDIDVALNGNAPVGNTGHIYEFVAPAASGTYPLEVAVSSLSGDQVTLIQQRVVVELREAPVVTITSPLEGHVYGPNQEITVDIDVQPVNGGGIDEDTVSVTLNGVAMTPVGDSNRTFTAVFPAVAPDSYSRFEIRATASNADGSRRSSPVTRGVFVDAQPPVVRVVTPSFGSSVPTNGIEIEVEAEDHHSGVNEIVIEISQSDVNNWVVVGNLNSPGRITWNGQQGGYLVRSTAYDEVGNRGVSSTVIFYANPAEADLTILDAGLSLIQPAGNAVQIAANTPMELIFLAATSTPDRDYEFRLGVDPIDSLNSSEPDPTDTMYDRFTWTAPADPGEYILWAWHTPDEANEPNEKAFVALIIEVIEP